MVQFLYLWLGHESVCDVLVHAADITALEASAGLVCYRPRPPKGASGWSHRSTGHSEESLLLV